MLALRYAYVLALVVWLGGMAVLGGVVAPIASELFGITLGRFHLVEYACGAILLLTLIAMAVLGPRPSSFATRLVIIVLMLGVVAYAGRARQPSAKLMTPNIIGALVLLYWEARDR